MSQTSVTRQKALRLLIHFYELSISNDPNKEARKAEIVKRLEGIDLSTFFKTKLK